MMLPSDMALLEDEKFLQHVKSYADNNDLFTSDFSKAYTKLTELGCKNLSHQKWTNEEETFADDRNLGEDVYNYLSFYDSMMSYSMAKVTSNNYNYKPLVGNEN